MISCANLYSKEVGQEHSTQRVQISNSILIVWKTGCQITILSPFHRIFVKYRPRCWSNIFLSIDQIFASKYFDQIFGSLLIKYCQKSSELKRLMIDVPLLLILELAVHNSKLIFVFTIVMVSYIGIFECYQHHIWLQKFSRDWELCTFNYLFQIYYISKMCFRVTSDH